MTSACVCLSLWSFQGCFQAFLRRSGDQECSPVGLSAFTNRAVFWEPKREEEIPTIRRLGTEDPQALPAAAFLRERSVRYSNRHTGVILLLLKTPLPGEEPLHHQETQPESVASWCRAQLPLQPYRDGHRQPRRDPLSRASPAAGHLPHLLGDQPRRNHTARPLRTAKTATVPDASSPDLPHAAT